MVRITYDQLCAHVGCLAPTVVREVRITQEGARELYFCVEHKDEDIA